MSRTAEPLAFAAVRHDGPRCDDGGPSAPFFGVLGPLEVRGDRGHIDLGPPQRRALLLRLLMEDCRPVSVGRICDDLWNGRPPASAASSVHAHISRLRSVLEEPTAGRTSPLLASTSAGYVLRAAPDRRDAVLFEEAVEHGHRLADEGRTDRALRTVERALARWRGQPYADAQAHSFARQEADRLTELHWSARDLRARLLLGEGRLEQAISTCMELVGENPLRETSWVTLLRALQADGRTAEALQRYETVRRTLADTLGADPGPLLRRTHLALLRQEPADGTPGTVRRLAVPAPAPAPVPTSRGRQLSALGELFARAGTGRTVWAVLHGATGTGKTWLLREFGRRARARGSVVVHDRYPRRTAPQGAAGYGGGAALRLLREPWAVPGGAARHTEPVLCLVDGVQNAPPEDLEALAVHADLPGEVPLMVVCAVTEVRDPAVAAFQARLARSGAGLIEVGPLDIADVEELLRARDTDRAGSPRTGGAVDVDGGAGPGDGPGAAHMWRPSGSHPPHGFFPPSAEAAGLHALTGGNAFYLTEVIGASDGLPAGTPVRVPHAVRCEVRARLAALSPDARRVVEAAVLSGPVEARFLARACALPFTVVLRALEDAADAGLMTWERAGGPSLSDAYAFSCELVRGALLADMPPSRAHTARTAVARAKTRPAEQRPGPAALPAAAATLQRG
ncbi:hypothetical protein ADK41_35445 [Streptomyces caelestis]|uniref:OmpR/PhoB-type domain-containing protein n=1 Tax=Streptomyces caelestis TaxID=36816 RepID=A0A0M8QCS4_9ACTN|nr:MULTISPECIES: BTAD domain-containing putative transcriptional regulator [Streptomyces]KOT28746.1 hypothetical protein ADK41_35445 [Streptomyces caelestis]KOV19293.1 hypothetical protein ADK58_35680 [Streptomyces sp. XY152]